MFRFIGVSVVVLAALYVGAHAGPRGASIQESVTVQYNDLDISKESGARALLLRIERASIAACGYSPYVRDPIDPTLFYLMQDYRRCRAAAIGNAVASVGAPLVTRLYAATSGARPDRLAGR